MSGLLRGWMEAVLGRKPATPAAPPKTEPAMVLVIDDDAVFLESTRAVLTTAGFKVMTANSGVKGLNMIRYALNSMQVVLLDYRMPLLDGEATLGYLREINPRLHVIAVSGVPAEEIPARFRVGVNRFLPKPFTNDDLIRAVRAAAPVAEPAAAL